jgi:TP901 family phage tail tape measure protein
LANDVAKANGVLTSDVLDMMKIYANAGETAASISEKIAGTVAFQNVTGLGGEEATNALQTIEKQYQLTANGAMDYAEAIQYIGDVTTGVAYSMSKDEGLAIVDIVEGMEGAGAIMRNAGANMEWYAAVVGTLSEQMNAAGSETANAMKMIVARTLQSKGAIEDLAESGEDMSEISEESSNAEKALASIGVKVREQGGNFRSFEDILTDVAAKWDTLNDSEKQYVSEKLAGNNRRNYFITLMESYERVEELATSAYESEGTLMESNERIAESLEGKIATLTATWENLLLVVGDTEAFKNAIDGLTGIMEAITNTVEHVDNNLLPTLAGIGTSIGVFAYKGIADKIALIGAKIMTMAGTATAAATAMLALKAALIGVGVAIGTYLLTKIPDLVNWLKQLKGNGEEATVAIQDMTENVSTYKESMENLDKAKVDVDQWINAQKEMEKFVEGTSAFNQQLELSEQAMASLGENYPDIASILQDENLELDNKLLKIQEINAELEKEYQLNLLNSMPQENDLLALQKQVQDDIALYEQYQAAKQAYNNGGSQFQVIGNSEFDMSDATTDNYFEGVGRNIAYGVNNLEIFNTQLEEAQDLGLALDRESVEVTQEMLDFKDQEVAKIWEENAAKQEALEIEKEKKALEESSGDDTGTGDTTDTGDILTSSKTDSDEQTPNQKYIETLETLTDIKELMDAINEEGLTLDNMSSVMDMFEDFEGNLNDQADVLDFLGNKYTEFENKAKNSYNNVLATSKTFWNEQMKNSQDWATYESQMYDLVNETAARAWDMQAGDFADFIQEKGIQRQFDVSNAETMAEAQAMIENQAVDAILTYWQGLVTDKGTARNTDAQNVANFLNWQGGVEIKTINDLATAWRQYYNEKVAAVQSALKELSAISAAGTVGVDGVVSTSFTSKEQILAMGNRSKDAVFANDTERAFNKIYNTVQDVRGALSLSTFFNDFAVGFDGITAGANQAAAATNGLNNALNNIGSGRTPGGSGGSGGSGSPSGGGSGSGGSATERVIEDLEDIRDLSFDVSGKLKDVENELSLIDIQMKKAGGKEYVSLYNRQIDLLKEKSKHLLEHKDILNQEAEELKNTLAKDGFKFDEDGTITNYMSQFENLRNWANSLAGDRKEEAKSYVEELMSTVNEYTDLIKDEIPGVAQEWEEMANTIREAEEQIANDVTDFQKEVASAIEETLNKRYDAIKEEIEKEKELYEQQYEEEDYESRLAEEQRALDEIQQQINDLSRDTSIVGQLKLEELRQEYEEQQKVINDMIRNREKDLGSQLFDDAIDELDKELEEQLTPENLADMVNQALVDGFVTIGDEVISLNTLMTDWLDETGDGLYAIGALLKSEIYDNMQMIKQLWTENADIFNGGLFSQIGQIYSVPTTEKIDTASIANNSRSVNVSSGDIIVQGNADTDTLSKLEALITKRNNELVKQINNALSTK